MLENEHTSQLHADLQRFSTLGFHYKAFVEELWLYLFFLACESAIFFHVYAKLSINSTYYLFITLTMNRYPRGTSRMRYIKRISFLAPKWNKLAVSVVNLFVSLSVSRLLTP